MEELVSCILSQHSADVVTFPTFSALMVQYREWDAIAALSVEELARSIKAVGLANQKAKSILAVLSEVSAKFGSYDLSALARLPLEESLAWLESLPGVGPKTASIVMCFSFGQHAIPVDTHVQRVCTRLGVLPLKANPKAAHALLRQVVPIGGAYGFHVALIEHGRAVCTARAPQCPRCVLKSLCPRIGVGEDGADV
ncbi:MAG: endonuclease III [Armatimonadota bacterium]